ncbi:MAG TPA: YIP1 family protein [Desulfobacteria bacterium]|nr:YIP1 family protein [Desulfobacteria bacterium]
MLEVLINPNGFFEARMRETESLKIPVLIVLISGLISGIAAYLITGLTLEMLSETLPPEALGLATTIGGISAFIGALVFSLIIWVIFAAIFFGISSVFKGEGSFKRTLEFVGYGYIPMILSGIISAVLMYNFISTAQIPLLTDPTEVAEVITQWVTTNPMVRLSSVIGMLFMLWSANIWIFGLKHARNLSTRNALITVAIPVALYILYSVWQLGVLGL